MLLRGALYFSFVQIGQDWYGYGWEIQLLEAGFLAIFLCPLLEGRPFPRRPPPAPVIWLFRWLIFRIMIGAEPLEGVRLQVPAVRPGPSPLHRLAVPLPARLADLVRRHVEPGALPLDAASGGEAAPQRPRRPGASGG